MKETLSIKLFNTLKKGKEHLANDALDRVLGFVESQRTNEDSFIDKSGKSDIYYTMFGWILSYVLGIKLDAKKTKFYLSQQNTQTMDLIHYAAYMRCCTIRKLIKFGKAGLFFDSLFSAPIDIKHISGFPHCDEQSPYSLFIYLSLLEDGGHKIKDKNNILSSLRQYKTQEGGYSNIKNSNKITTNATVAALAIKGQLEGYKNNDEIDTLCYLQEESGGFAATKESPIPDILSTATSLFIMNCYNKQPKFSAEDFIEAHWLDSGGFSATILEEISDVEYTFYGLLALGTL